jgi:hypothetical protein
METGEVKTKYVKPSEGNALKHVINNTVHFGITYLAKDDKKENYVEITLEEAENIREEQKAELKAKIGRK